MSDTYRNAQRAYDHQSPDDIPDEWIDTAHGENWLDGAASDLESGGDLIIGGHLLVTVGDLEKKLVEYALENDRDGFLGQILRAASDYDIATASGCARHLFAAKPVHEFARDLCRPHWQAALDEIIEQNRED